MLNLKSCTVKGRFEQKNTTFCRKREKNGFFRCGFWCKLLSFLKNVHVFLACKGSYFSLNIKEKGGESDMFFRKKLKLLDFLYKFATYF